MSFNVEKVERYRYKGTEYSTLDKVKTQVENDLGALIDKLDIGVSTPKIRIALFNLLVENRTDFVNALTVEFDQSDDPMYSEMMNLLDY